MREKEFFIDNLMVRIHRFSGDLYVGYGLVLDVLKDEMSDLLDSVHFELRLFFAVYSILLVFGSDHLSRSKVDGFVP